MAAPSNVIVRTFFRSKKIVAAGNSQGTATACAVKGCAIVLVTGADGTKGIILPAVQPAGSLPKILVIKNQDSDNAILKIYPATGEQIDALGANNAYSLTAKMATVLTQYKGAWSSKHVPYVGGA